jgi:hypothetical protein
MLIVVVANPLNYFAANFLILQWNIAKLIDRFNYNMIYNVVVFLLLTLNRFKSLFEPISYICFVTSRIKEVHYFAFFSN